jgi:hypothetical protein
MPSTKAALGKLYIQAEELRSRRSKLRHELTKLENEGSQLSARIFTAELDLAPEWEEVPRDKWGDLRPGEEAAIVIKRPKNDESWCSYGVVDTWGQWSRGITCNGTHFSAVDGLGKPIEGFVGGHTVKIWTRIVD